MKIYKVADCFKSKHFSYRDSDLDNWLPKKLPVLEDKPITIYYTKYGQTFKDMFADNKLNTEADIIPYCFSLQQIEKMCEDDSRLDKNWWNFFPVTDGKQVFVLRVRWGGGRWCVLIIRLDRVFEWYAVSQLFLRNFVPLTSPDTLTSQHVFTTTIEQAITLLKKEGYTITKTF